MNAERLLENYEKVADAPDAIARLRRFVLDLAVRGKPAPQDANDEPESELLRLIAKEKLDQAGVPQGWRRAKIGSILDFQYGKGLKASERLDEGPVPVFGSNGIVGFTDQPLTDRPAIIVGRKGSAGALNLCDGPSWTTDVAYFVEAPFFLDLRFMLNALAALDLDKLGKGVKPGLSRSEAYDQIIALPPLAEQRRIVAKVDELITLCDRLEAARADRETTRDRLATAILGRRNAPDHETFRADANLALAALPALTTRPDQIKALRQTILNLAVHGKLVPQDPIDEPASELLERIAKEKARLVKSGKIRALKATPALPETPFPIPASWRWSQLAEVGILSPRNDAPDTLEASFVPMPLIAAGYGIANRHEVRPWGHIKKGYTHFSEGDVGLAKITPCFENGKSTVFRNLTGGIGTGTTELHIVRPLFVDQDYVLLFLKSPHFIETGIPKMTGTAGQKRVPAEYFAHSPFPLPPLGEQRRIVAKVNTLMNCCDQLEASLTATAAARSRLLDALLAEALAPAGDRKLQAVE